MNERELDAKIAERVMGWTKPTREFQPWDMRPDLPGCVLCTRQGLPRFSTSIADAMLVVPEMQKRDWFFQIDNFGFGGEEWRAVFRRDLGDDAFCTAAAHAATAPLAITQAALNACATDAQIAADAPIPAPSSPTGDVTP